MYNIYSKEDFYRSKAEYFEGVAVMRRLTACVHLEGESDKHFWSQVFKRYFPDCKFFFLSYSKLSGDKRVSGVDHCLKYAPYLSKRFFICIDSDYRYLLGEHKINIKNFIFQTYTYSIENHYCFSKNLEKVCHQSTGYNYGIFDFKIFFKNYSNIIHRLFIWHLYLIENQLPGLSKLKFNNLLDSFPKINLENNGQEMLHYFKDLVDRRVQKIEDNYPSVDIEEYIKFYKTIGLNCDNTYLYVRGHNIYELVISIGRSCNRELLNIKKSEAELHGVEIERIFENSTSFEKQLIDNLPLKGYKEVDKLIKDIEFFRMNISGLK